MHNPRGDASWRSGTPTARRKMVGGPGRLQLNDVVVLLVLNAVISLIISVVVFLVLSRMIGWGGGAGPDQQTVLANRAGTTVTTGPTEGGQVQEQSIETQEEGDVYVVKSGENLTLIADRFGVTLEDLMAVNGISNPDWIGVGQRLIIPKPGVPTPTFTVPPIPTLTETPLPFDPPTPFATATPSSTRAPATVATGTPPRGDATPAPRQLVLIDSVIDAGKLDSERVVLVSGGNLVNLEGWTLSDKDGNTFSFPAVLLWADGAQLNVHTRAGRNTPKDIFWGREKAVWGEAGEVVTLRDAQGKEVATFRP